MVIKTRVISLPDALAGMVLAAPVRDSAGNDLLAAGTELTAALLASLLHRGVAQLQVAEDVPLSAAELAERRAAVVERLEFLFRHSGDDALMTALHTAILEYRLEGLR
ncbi:MAG: hypothetical protein KGZ83_22225 [Sulfuricella sp.]|nr:hypothetical protein [Sulfuricella sp.]